jgi:hypothetical protein
MNYFFKVFFKIMITMDEKYHSSQILLPGQNFKIYPYKFLIQKYYDY